MCVSLRVKALISMDMKMADRLQDAQTERKALDSQMQCMVRSHVRESWCNLLRLDI